MKIFTILFFNLYHNLMLFILTSQPFVPQT